MGGSITAGAVAGFASASSLKSTSGQADIPADYLALYQEAAAGYGLPWQLLAAIGRVESDHGRNPNAYHPNEAGAEGPMQFIPSSWARYAGASGSLHPDINNPPAPIFPPGPYPPPPRPPPPLPPPIYPSTH